ncbi:GNAT family N-acetyltransferase [Paenibacillus hodogayensis]|uniref:GNAT family N-acetyltransferase n=1 Tax=Paenibacillus hodogayensis TaxID=279208 RepID=A0ABV5VUF9_9BACL
MIRARKPRLDDSAILDMIKRELFVFTVATKPDMRWNPAEVRTRLNGNVTFVAASARTVGFASVRPVGSDMLLDMLAVERGSQGLGWGSALLDTAEAYARRKGNRTMRLFVDAANGKARAFYARKGYAEERYYPTMAFISMTKRL